MSGLRRQSLVSAGIQMLGQVVVALLGVATARYLGAAGFGIFAMSFAIMRVSMIVSELGMPVLAVREYVRLFARADWSTLKGLLIFSTAVVLIVSGLLSLTGWLVLRLPFVDLEPDLRNAFGAILFLFPIAALLRLYASSLRGLGQIVLGQFFELLLAPALVLGAIVYFIAIRDPGLPRDVIGIYALSYLFAIVLCAVTILRSVPKDTFRARATYRGGEWLRGGAHFVLAGGAMLLNTQVDVIVLGFFVPPDQVGFYRAATQTAFLSSFIIQVMYTVSTPRFASLYERREFRGLWAMYRLARNMGAMGVAAALLVFFFFGREILDFAFGEGFGDGWAALVVLCASMLISALFGPNEALLSMTGGERRLSRIVLIGVTLNITLNLVLIPLFGILGAAYATAASAVVTKAILWRDVQRTIPDGS